MTFAVIKTGGKQYIVSPNDTIKIEKLTGEAGNKISFSDVLLVGDEGSCTVGTPTVAKAAVEGEIMRQARDKKKIVFKYHSKTRYRKLKGHRQPFTEVKITNIKSA
ncbi:50S ribosomal protein L21 [Candidatus Wolfebacteria bacterium RIFCSPHIGHO2_01_FULL_48_22]|uniref:Large ribosomal subunit protein bL21 n=2 Tax=Candidatus Wolfeibacteriota TaxID=1752735 RepID=A0A1F8DSD0_9BACT|nr:MAG: 50S ribosomal protein L21 [Candidatus Wolfebacteria bacterium RIFCSPHIGHO2_01_FULL_48_22]OGM92195.1 MAG: 50S ribosomal protein L21 [Candidatus Wolfebacteria bacterium RIFCSPLOWO2_01_FULL_47_17b]